jgi:alpha-beta hydrolase superfamily lysophospholipase
VAITHGLGEHSGRYAALANALVAKRYTVVGLDLPGHGEAPGPRGDTIGWIAWRDSVIPPMFTVSRGLPGQPPDLPVVLLGHSMGGLLALDFALTHPRSLLGVVASAPAFRDAKEPPRSKLTLAKIARVVAPGVGFPHGLDESGMSRDPEVLALRKSDGLVHDRISPRLYFDLLEARARVMSGGRRIAVPVLIQQGSADRVVDPRGALEFTGAAAPEMVRLMTYRDAYHEIYNDPARDEAIRDLLGWLEVLVVA